MKIVYFDGHCNLCNGFIDFLIRRDSRHILKFAPLQGQTARTRLAGSIDLSAELATVVFENDGVVHIESAAALRALAQLGGVYSILKILLLVPPFIRDSVYRWISQRRYAIWGKRDSCRLPTPDERAFFLD